MKKYLFLLIPILILVLMNYKKEELIKVEIKGAVIYPGVYNVSNNTNINDLIILSGGLRYDANISNINLTKRLDDNDVVVIYTDYDIKTTYESDNMLNISCNCPYLEKFECIETVKDNLININTATKEQLMTLSGIGSKKADDIIEYRKNNKFNKKEDIMNIKGIGEKMFEKIKDYIRV